MVNITLHVFVLLLYKLQATVPTFCVVHQCLHEDGQVPKIQVPQRRILSAALEAHLIGVLRTIKYDERNIAVELPHTIEFLMLNFIRDSFPSVVPLNEYPLFSH